MLQALQQKGRRSVLLVSNSDDLVVDLAAALASAMSAKDAPEGLQGRRLMDVTGGNRPVGPQEPPHTSLSPKGGEGGAEETALERMRQLLAEATDHPEVLLLVPTIQAEPKEARGGKWTGLLQAALVKGKVQFICRVTPKLFAEHLRKDAVWKQHTHAIWLEQVKQGSMPREL